jgi:hypothetical protein
MDTSMPWFIDLITTCDPQAGIPVQDADIDAAQYFDGYQQSYMNWPKHLWYAPNAKPSAVPCMDVEKNAYHIQQLAKTMQETNSWIGEPPELDSNRVVDGNHRVRAAQYLYTKHNLAIPKPEKIRIFQ